MNDYQKAVTLGLTKHTRWKDGTPHHPMSERHMDFLADHDFNDCGDSFCWETGGDGDNGENLMYEMDVYFDLMDQDKLPAKNEVDEKMELAKRLDAEMASVRIRN